MAELVADRMQTLGYDRVLTDEFGNVVGVLYGRQGQPSLILSSHMDTADAGGLNWSWPPPHR